MRRFLVLIGILFSFLFSSNSFSSQIQKVKNHSTFQKGELIFLNVKEEEAPVYLEGELPPPAPLNRAISTYGRENILPQKAIYRITKIYKSGDYLRVQQVYPLLKKNDHHFWRINLSTMKAEQNEDYASIADIENIESVQGLYNKLFADQTKALAAHSCPFPPEMYQIILGYYKSPITELAANILQLKLALLRKEK